MKAIPSRFEWVMVNRHEPTIHGKTMPDSYYAEPHKVKTAYGDATIEIYDDVRMISTHIFAIRSLDTEHYM